MVLLDAFIPTRGTWGLDDSTRNNERGFEALTIAVLRPLRTSGSVGLSRSAIVAVPLVRTIFDDDDPERGCKQRAQATALFGFGAGRSGQGRATVFA